jgi:hypothetical protein
MSHDNAIRVRGASANSYATVCDAPPLAPPSPRKSGARDGESETYSVTGLSEMSQSFPLKIEMNSVFIGV